MGNEIVASGLRLRILRLNPAEVQPESINDSEKFAHLTEGLLEKLVACRRF
ncbi:MAG: hypothetical protein WKF71_14290 [Pyrinomonadaceae bacterium]